MRNAANAGDLLERMQRVAVKQPRPAPLRRTRSTQHRRTTLPPAPRRSRLQTLVAWGRWEVTFVPAHRWRWLTSVVRGRAG